MLPFVSLLPVIKGLFSVLWEALKTPLSIPIWLIFLTITVGIYIKDSAVSQAVKDKVIDLTIGAELKAKDLIIANQKFIIAEKDRKLQEHLSLLRIYQDAFYDLEAKMEEDDKILKEAMDKINELSETPPESCVIDEFIFNRLRNQ